MSNSVQSEPALCEFLLSVLPAAIPPQNDMAPHLRTTDIHAPVQLIQRGQERIKKAPVAVSLSPHLLRVINWQDPLNDPVQ
ncbi:L-lysine 2-3-aminomutase [Penicillium canescens]|nr:L-lysine 2-3-aminomutase [Penicillium canescens]KAJ6029227.1 L-lysine 2-3-aminomutase [Penicillium canescens]KAJ6048746.1 L-lysine 2-3-aminomutase [Penicillium canescens]KAJ6100743.1 L-lysine 2-3-aminomutase [Penicillium canescens]